MDDEIIRDRATARTVFQKAVAKSLNDYSLGEEDNEEDSAEDCQSVSVVKNYCCCPSIQKKFESTIDWILSKKFTPRDFGEEHRGWEIEERVSDVTRLIIGKSLVDTPILEKRLADVQAENKRLKQQQESINQSDISDDGRLPSDAAENAQKDEDSQQSEPFLEITSIKTRFMGPEKVRLDWTDEVRTVGMKEEMQAGAAAGKLLAQWLRRDRGVQQFRREVLQGHLFPDDVQGHEDAWRFITSPLPQVLAAADYIAHGLCPATAKGRLLSRLNHVAISLNDGLTSRAVSRHRDGEGRSILVFAVEIDAPDGSTQRLHVEHSTGSYCCIGPQECDLAMPLTPSVRYSGSANLGPSIPPCFARPSAYRPAFVEGYGESVVNQAMMVVSNLLASFPTDVWQLLNFLLTDAVPNTIPIRVLEAAYDYHLLDKDFSFVRGFWADGGITLHVQPWVQPESLANHWRSIRRSTKHLPKEEALELFNFALDNTAPDQEFSWRELVKQWTQEGKRHLGDNPSDTFRKAIRGTREALFPEFRAPGPGET